MSGRKAPSLRGGDMSPLKRCLLLLNVALEDVARSTTATSGKLDGDQSTRS